MGYSTSTGVGAYLEVYGTVVRVKTRQLCSNDNAHKVNSFGEFCPHCGSPVIEDKEDIEIPVGNAHYMSLFETDEEMAKFTDVMRSPEYCDAEDPNALVVLGNRTDSYSWLSDKVKEITPELKDLYVGEFEKDYADFLEWLDDSRFTYAIKFGVINYTD